MLIKDFNFDLPKELIAQNPVNPKSKAKLLVVDKADKIDKHIYDLPHMFNPNDLFVVNDTKVIPVKLRCINLNLTLTLLNQLTNLKWSAYAKPLKKCIVGDVLYFSEKFKGKIIQVKNDSIIIEFILNNSNIFNKLNKYGELPLPPYIKRKIGPQKSDIKDYNTIFANSPGSIAAPTAGLHFDKNILKSFKSRNINFTSVTLHIGRGTFLPIRTKDSKEHIMHSEKGFISSVTANKINETKKRGGKVIAVGTTVLRLLESAKDKEGYINKFNGKTDIFIVPGYKIKSVDYLLTNFHLPKSTLFMLVCAFSGTKRLKSAYRYAISNGYRFYSYGDAMLLSKS